MKKVARSRVCVVFPAEKLTVPPNGKYNYDGRMCAAQTSRSDGCSFYANGTQRYHPPKLFWLRPFYDVDIIGDLVKKLLKLL